MLNPTNDVWRLHVQGLFADANFTFAGTIAEQEPALLAKLNAYWDLVQRTPRIVGMNVWHWDDIPPSLVPPPAATGCGKALAASCLAAATAMRGGGQQHRRWQCDACVGKHQPTLTAAGCTAAQTQQFCVTYTESDSPLTPARAHALPGQPATEYNYGAEALPSVAARLEEIRAELAGPVSCRCYDFCYHWWLWDSLSLSLSLSRSLARSCARRSFFTYWLSARAWSYTSAPAKTGAAANSLEIHQWYSAAILPWTEQSSGCSEGG
jgi:hypothetical protein